MQRVGTVLRKRGPGVGGRSGVNGRGHEEVKGKYAPTTEIVVNSLSAGRNVNYLRSCDTLANDNQ